ncbi:MAG: hypothetical protein HDR79_07045 [Bacteroides sp.]|nr:hypothetical protein [Bacteroides sp.]MBD5364688.1 hypothetical protein [Bacteroides sp.]
MKNNKYRRPNGTTHRLRRMEDKLDIILSDLNRIHVRMNRLQAKIDAINELEMDSAINRLRFSAMNLKQLAQEEAERIRERYATTGI